MQQLGQQRPLADAVAAAAGGPLAGGNRKNIAQAQNLRTARGWS
ncbi:MAG TPA: hypothetical protein VN894_20880 [Polyangiaceae bacterium]|nr:hypothetical protein [Polyangiaceae bacterium]